MPAHVTPRNLRGDARIDLDGQLDDLVEIVEAVENIDAVWQQFKARVLRGTSKANRARHQAVEALDRAQAVEDAPWDGKDRRRANDRRHRGAPPQGPAAAEIVAFEAVAA